MYRMVGLYAFTVRCENHQPTDRPIHHRNFDVSKSRNRSHCGDHFRMSGNSTICNCYYCTSGKTEVLQFVAITHFPACTVTADIAICNLPWRICHDLMDPHCARYRGDTRETSNAIIGFDFDKCLILYDIQFYGSARFEASVPFIGVGHKNRQPPQM